MGGNLENDCEDKIEKYGTIKAFQAADHRSYEEMVDIAVGHSSKFFDRELERLNKSKLYDSLKKLFDTHSESLSKIHPIEKIVAFGGGTLKPAQRYADAGSSCGAQRTQHATLLVARDMLWEYSENSKGVAMKDDIKILIQDPEYLDIDERIANLNGMEVLKCDTDKHTQAGWAKIDESTFFFDLGTTFPLHQLLFEITRPAAIFSPDKIVEDSFLPNIAFPATIMLEDGKEIDIAGVGRSGYTFMNFTKDCECYKMDLEGLELGSRSKKELGWDFNDGHSGGTHIGRKPTPYIRRPHVVENS
ncbi:hypothetical protein HYALB_00013695 [Hymenoscyphus albidus]|uniref:SRR1-like domain-containing protein n=1 Tax=Hymenoscyphus albidus TaxID=595503 RepID=A0A9N9Q5P8_9HELO|nr:hypothetical protein HYALB_00013695 [Hymenoscyphus albidus]